MHYFALHNWSKFETIFTTFWEVTSKKPLGSSLKWYFLLVRKLCKDENSGITSQIIT